MIIFWILAAGLVALALLFVAVPLLRPTAAAETPTQDSLNIRVLRQRLEELDADRAAGFLDQAQYEAARHDLEREALADLDRPQSPASAATGGSRRAPVLALVLAVAIPLGAVLVYLKLGQGDLIPQLESTAAAGAHGTGGMDPTATASLDSLAQGLAAKLAKDPNNLDGWLMLGRTYAATNQPSKALEALEHAYKLAPQQPDVIVAYAEVLAANAGNRLAGRPAELIRTALEIEPSNVYARLLGGLVDNEAGRYADAAKTWEDLLPELDAGSEEALQLRQMIAKARERAGLPPMAEGAAQSSPGSAGSQAAAAPSKASIQVKVALSPDLAAAADPNETVFVFARADSGPPMPLAVQRLKVSDLPATVTLDDSMAVMPQLRLSAFPRVVAGARISKTGQATPASGDLEGQSQTISVASAPEVSVTIDRKRP